MRLANLSDKSKNNIRAISISLLLPIWSIFTNTMPTHFDFLNWLAISFILYCMWQAIYLISKNEEERKWLKILISNLLVIAFGYVFFVMVILHDIDNFKWLFVFKLLIVAILFRFIQFGIRANDDRDRLKMEKQQMLAENYRVQLQELRTKVDPHFLFNSLNTLRVMVRNGNKESERFIMSLSDFYRQTLKYNESSVVTIEEEMGVLNSYLFLMKARNQGAVCVKSELPEAIMNYKVPTLSMQILIENCFKHNSMSTSSPLQIDVYSNDNYICVRNNIQPKMTQSQHSGFGLSNIRKRYDLLGVINDSVIINKTEEHFEVKLKLIK
jgi:two-component system, LytTR family, sensor kinase